MRKDSFDFKKTLMENGFFFDEMRNTIEYFLFISLYV